jgi:protein phosphatase
MAIHMDCDGLTDKGRMRDTNQDQFLIADLRKSLELHRTSLDLKDHTRLFGVSHGKLLLVADGMGGHAGGERASTLAVDTLAMYVLNSQRWLYRLEEGGEEDFVDDLKVGLKRCQDSVEAEGESTPRRRGMGTTLTMAYVIWPRVYVVHAGDSRCYLSRDSKLWQITKDHTMAQEFVDAGVLSPVEAEESRWSHTLWNSIGGPDEVQPEVHKAELLVGDSLLLCSDGLTKHVADEQIQERLGGDETAESACQSLVDAANQAGGSDNITVVVARFREGEEQQAMEARTAESQPVSAETGGASGIQTLPRTTTKKESSVAK